MKIELEIEKVKYLSRLARIDLTDEELDLLSGQLNSVLEYVRKLDKVDTASVPATFHVMDISNVFREDVGDIPLPEEDVLQMAPEKKDGFVKVPRVIETE